MYADKVKTDNGNAHLKIDITHRLTNNLSLIEEEEQKATGNFQSVIQMFVVCARTHNDCVI